MQRFNRILSQLLVFGVSVLGLWAPAVSQESSASAEQNSAFDPDEIDEYQFEIGEFEIVGPELVPREQLQAVLARYLNKPLTFSRLRSVTLSLEGVHASAGYEVVRVIVPEQNLKPGGGLKLEVVDIRLGEVLVDGAKRFSHAWVRSQLPGLVKNQPVNTRRMDQEIRLLKSNPVIDAAVSLEPSFEPRKVDALLKFSDRPVKSTFLTLDNTGTAATGEYRAGLVFQHNNVAEKGHQFTGQVVTSPGHWADVKVFSLAYKVPVANDRTLLEVAYINSSVDAGTVDAGGGILSIEGSGDQLALRSHYFMERIRGFDTRLIGSYQIKRFDSNVLLNGDPTSIVPDTASRPLGLGLLMKKAEQGVSTDMSINYFANLETGSNNSGAAHTLSNGRVNFELLKGSLSRSAPLHKDWRYTASVDFQLTKDSLITGEQFGAGGMRSVRGFDERTISADSGYDFTFEMQSGNVLKQAPEWVKSLSYVAFADAAKLRSNAASTGAATEPFIASMGFGVRLTLAPAQLIRADVARVISGVATQPHGDVMLHVSYAALL